MNVGIQKSSGYFVWKGQRFKTILPSLVNFSFTIVTSAYILLFLSFHPFIWVSKGSGRIYICQFNHVPETTL